MNEKEEFFNQIDLDGTITIASRIKRLYELLFVQLQELYDLRDRGFKASWFSILASIRKNPQVDFKTLAEVTNVSASAVSQTMRELETNNLVQITQGQDRRSRMIKLTDKAIAFLDSVVPDLMDIEKVISNIMGDSSSDLLEKLNVLEKSLKEKSIIERIDFEIVTEEALANWHLQERSFSKLDKIYDADLNMNFESNPEPIIEAGGQVFYVIQSDVVIASIVLIAREHSCFEIASIKVVPKFKDKGIVEALLNKSLEFIQSKSGKQLFVLTNSKFKIANKIFSQHNFLKSNFVEQRGSEIFDRKYSLDINN